MLVVVLIIGILVAAAIPTLAGSQVRAKDARARSTASLGIKTARATVVHDYAEVTTEVLQASEPSVVFVDGETPSSGPGVISAEPIAPVGARSGVVVAVKSDSGTCFIAKYVMGEAPAFARVPETEVCDAAQHEAVDAADWSSKP